MIALGIDPGPLVCGVAFYLLPGLRCVESHSALPLDEVLDLLSVRDRLHFPDLVAIERVQSCGISGASLLETSEVVGRLQQRALDTGIPVVLLYRREVLLALDVTGTGSRDVVVRQRLLEMHGGASAVGRKATPGPLYGVSGHAWQALAVAVAAVERRP